MSACIYEIGPGRQSPDPQDPKRKPIALALVAVSLATASLSFAAALLGIFPAAPKPVAAAKPALVSYGSTYFTAPVAKRGEAWSSAPVGPRERSSKHVVPQLVWAATLSVHVHVAVYGAKATFMATFTATSTGRVSTTGPKGSR
jgi:hypothetical protein